MIRVQRLFSVLVAIMLLAGCATVSEQPPTDDQLYRNLGGKPGIRALVTQLLVNISDDQRIVHHFADTNIERLREKLEEQICVESGGPCEYTGDGMRRVHEGLQLTEADFNALVEDLQRAMEQQHLPIDARNGLLARLARMHDEVLGRVDY